MIVTILPARLIRALGASSLSQDEANIATAELQTKEKEMVRTLLASVLLLGLTSITSNGNYTLKSFAGNTNQPAESQFAGLWYGEWSARPAGTGYFEDGEEHVGTVDISVESDGEIKGTVFDKTAGTKGLVKGFIDEEGYINLSLKYNTTTIVKGTLEKRGVRLTGTLKQYCGGKLCPAVDITFKRK